MASSDGHAHAHDGCDHDHAHDGHAEHDHAHDAGAHDEGPSGHGHHGHHHHHAPKTERALIIAIILNGLFLGLEAGVGFYTDSLALLSDAGHMVSDVGALIVALLALRLSTRRPSEGFTFGLRRAPVLGALINGVSLVVIVVLIFWEAAGRFAAPPVIEPMWVLITGVAGLGVNLGSAWYLHRSDDHSVNTRGAMLHLLSDALGSVAAIIAALAVWLFAFPLADPIASVIIGALILLSSLPLLRDTLAILLQRAPSNVDVPAVRKAITEHEAVVAVEHLHIWAIDSGQAILTAILTTKSSTLAESNVATDSLRALLKRKFHIEHATIECRCEHAETPMSGC